MTSADTTPEANPTPRGHRTILRVASVAFVGAIAAVSLVALSDDDPEAATSVARTSAPAAVRSMTPDAAERWLVDEVDDEVDEVPMTPDAAEQWLADDEVDEVPMTPDAAEQWLVDD